MIASLHSDGTGTRTIWNDRSRLAHVCDSYGVGYRLSIRDLLVVEIELFCSFYKPIFLGKVDIEFEP